jgi:hypothetical protein
MWFNYLLRDEPVMTLISAELIAKGVKSDDVQSVATARGNGCIRCPRSQITNCLLVSTSYLKAIKGAA